MARRVSLILYELIWTQEIVQDWSRRNEHRKMRDKSLHSCTEYGTRLISDRTYKHSLLLDFPCLVSAHFSIWISLFQPQRIVATLLTNDETKTKRMRQLRQNEASETTHVSKTNITWTTTWDVNWVTKREENKITWKEIKFKKKSRDLWTIFDYHLVHGLRSYHTPSYNRNKYPFWQNMGSLSHRGVLSTHNNW